MVPQTWLLIGYKKVITVSFVSGVNLDPQRSKSKLLYTHVQGMAEGKLLPASRIAPCTQVLAIYIMIYIIDQGISWLMKLGRHTGHLDIHGALVIPHAASGYYHSVIWNIWNFCQQSSNAFYDKFRPANV